MRDKVIRSPVNGAILPEGRPFVQGEAQREISSRGGKKAAENRRAKKALRDELIDLLMVETESKDGKKHTTQEAISVAIIRKAMNGDTKAFEIIRDTVGEKPVQKIANVTPAPDVVDSVERALFGDDAG